MWLYPIWGLAEYNEQATNAAKESIKKEFKILNTHLMSHTYMVGETITLADIVLCCIIWNGIKLVCDASFRKPFGNLMRWFKTVTHQPHFLEVSQGPLHYCVTPAQPKVVEKPVAKVVVEKPEKKEEDDAEEEVVETKKKNPLDLLPPSKLNLHEFKNVFSNTKDIRNVALPYLWEHFDENEWSFWFADYLFDKDLTKIFMSSNLIRGFIQRLEAARKYSMGIIILFGTENNSQIHACFLIRGTVLPAEFTSEMCEDVDSYKWTKVDLSDSAQKALVEDFFDQEGKFGGKYPEINDVKVFK